MGLVMFRLGSSPLGGTEGHRALTAQAMAESGSVAGWIVPRLYGQVYLLKPPMHYWSIAVIETVTGLDGPWVWRLPSALSLGLLAVVVTVFSRRWFGHIAGWSAGVALMLLVAVWMQSRTADIDPLHNLVTTFTACCIIELLTRRQRRWHPGWLALLAVGFAMVLLTKLHAGLPVVVGAVLGGSIGLGRWGRLMSPRVWLPMVVGTVLAMIWGLAVYWQLSQQPGGMDWRGLTEASTTGTNWTRWVWSSITSLQMLAFSLPVSLALVLQLWPGRRTAPERAMAWTVVFAMIIAALAAVVNVRYLYVAMPMLAVLAGAVCQRWATGRLSMRWGVEPGAVIRLALGMTGVGVGVATAVFAAIAASRTWANWPTTSIVTIAAGVSGLTACVFAASGWARARNRSAAAMLVAVMLCFGVAMGQMHVHKRQTHRDIAAAMHLRDKAGPGTTVWVGDVIWTKPFILHYAGIDVAGRQALADPRAIASDQRLGGHDVILALLSGRECQLWRQLAEEGDMAQPAADAVTRAIDEKITLGSQHSGLSLVRLSVADIRPQSDQQPNDVNAARMQTHE